MFSFFKRDQKPAEPPAGAAVGAQHAAPVPPAAPVSQESTSPVAHQASATGGTPELRPDPAVAIPEPPADFDVSALIEPAAARASGKFAPVAGDDEATQQLKPQVVQAISTVFDPEIPVNIFELGLVYDIRIGADRRVWVDMTLTSPNCPSAQALPHEVQYKTKAVPGVTDAHVEIVWEPPWSMEKMSDAARLQLGLL